MIVLQCDICLSMDNNVYGASCCDKCWNELRQIVLDYAAEYFVSEALLDSFQNMKPMDVANKKPGPLEKDRKIGWDASRR